MTREQMHEAQLVMSWQLYADASITHDPDEPIVGAFKKEQPSTPPVTAR